MIRRIAIVGGGPAGATCATALAAGGLDVDLFEASPDGEKPCGGGVPGAALDEFPVLRDPPLARRVVREVHLHSPAGRVVRLALREGIHVFRRRELDTFLRGRAQAAGASLCEMRVLRIFPKGDGRWMLETESGVLGPYDFLVGADGVRGIVRRTAASRTADTHLTLARYTYTQGVPREEMILKFFSGSDGYLWVFPRTDHVSIGICATRPNSSAARLEENLMEFTKEHYPEAARGEPAVRGYFIPADPSPSVARRGECWALIGDAGGFVDPVTREGIAPAMRSAVQLAASLLAHTHHSSLMGMARWPQRPESYPATPTLPEDLKLAHAYRKGFYSESFVERMVWMASESPSIARILADLFEGKQGYRGLKRRLLLNALPCGMEVGLGALLGRRTPSTRRPAA